MEYQDYIGIQKEIYDNLLYFIDDEDQIDANFEKLINIINLNKYQEKSEEFKSILYLIRYIIQNHHRTISFFDKIERILLHYIDALKENYTKEELFSIFHKCPQIIFFLFDKKIIPLDDWLTELLVKGEKSSFTYRRYAKEKSPDFEKEQQKSIDKKNIFKNYKYYFLPYIQIKLGVEERGNLMYEIYKTKETNNVFDDFNEKCRIGENDSYICQLIREDSIEEFIQYINKKNIPLKSKIKQSIFETNPLLAQKEATLIEYAAFFGSIQIFQYLRINHVELTPSLWIYAIHGNNPEIIHILEYDQIVPSDASYFECLKESIKCHHNEMGRYFEINFIKEGNFKNNPICYGFHYYNYDFLQKLENLQFALFYASLYDHFTIVKLLTKSNNVDINQSIILKYNTYKVSFYILMSMIKITFHNIHN